MTKKNYFTCVIFLVPIFTLVVCLKEKIYLPTLTISQEPEPQDAASHEPERQKHYPAPQPCVVQIVDTTEKKKKKIQLYRIHLTLRPLPGLRGILPRRWG